MQKLFYPGTVTIVRKKGDTFSSEDILTQPVLPDALQQRETTRTNTIERLRRDPSVALVLEERDGRCEEHADLQDGFSLTVSASDSPEATAAIELKCDGDIVLSETYLASEFGDECERDMLDELVDRLSLILDLLENKDYSFLPDGCPHLERVGSGEPISFYEARYQLEEAGYQTEAIHTVGHLRAPTLFVHENEIVLLGSHRFAGEDFYLEMKRLFTGITREALLDAVKRVKEGNELIDVIEWEDGSWSFRVTMDEDLYKDNFIQRLESDLAELRSILGRIEDIVGEEPWSIMREQRQLFIFEVIDASLRYSKMKI